ncbi:MAG TPA: deoxyribose-phosphate aldolase [Saprospiraceae bacterium]|nr:deoxyribose-phosphate aldolase [Saprospiraceae bacterium]
MELATYIDHTYLRPDCTSTIMDRIMAEAAEYGFKAICIPPIYVPYVKEKSGPRKYLLCTVAGFPIGYDHTEAKTASLRKSAALGAEEVDVVINLSNVKSGYWTETKSEMQALHETAGQCRVTLKCIIEAQLLTNDEILQICEISNALGLNYVKTSTGFFGDPVSVDKVKLLRQHLLPAIRIKASGGINQYQQAIELIQAGADRLGCSQSINIVKGAPN